MDLAIAAQELSASLRHLPPTAHLLAAGGMIVGLVLWMAGQSILRLIFAALGSLTGAGVGFFLLPIIAPETVAGFPSPHVGLGAGGLIGLLLGIALFRFAVAILLGGGFAVAATLIAAAGVQFQPVSDTEGLRRDYERLSAPLDPGLITPLQVPLPNGHNGALPPEYEPIERHDHPENGYHEADKETGNGDRVREVINSMKPVAERIRVFIVARVDDFLESWETLTGRQQAIVISSSFAGLAAGFLLGFLFPGRSSAAATAMAGAAVWIPSLVWLWRAMEAPGAESMLSLSPAVWLVIWGAASVAGFAIQSARSTHWKRVKS